MSEYRVYGPLEHYDYGVLDAYCTCPLCEDWRNTLSAVKQAKKATRGHGASCRCPSCTEKYRLRLSHLAAISRRDVYCESSWHSSKNKWGPHYMAWLTTEVKEDPNEPERTLNWWATYSYVEPMYYWFRGFNIALAESGIDPMYRIRIDA